MAGDKMSAPFTVQVPSTTDPGDRPPPVADRDPGDTARPSTPPRRITLASELDADIYYTIDGTPAVAGGLPSDTAQLYTGPIAISRRSRSTPSRSTAPATSRRSPATTSRRRTPPRPRSRSRPSPARAGQAAVTISWAAPETGVTGYGVQLYVDNRRHQGQPRGRSARRRRRR